MKFERWLLTFAWQDLIAHWRFLRVFVASLILGVTLIAATGSLYQVVSQSLLADTRALMGGDFEVDASQPLPEPVMDWLQANGTVSLVRELDTMVSSEDGSVFFRTELLIPDQHYPLYGQVQLQPEQSISQATALNRGELWGAALDPLLAQRLGLGLGDTLEIGYQRFEIRALIQQQPDRRLNANWRGLPIMLSEAGLEQTGLLRPGSRVDYEYRVRISGEPKQWEEAFYEAFPTGNWELQSFSDRSERISERLEQVASALVLIAFTTLFIGGLGIGNSVTRYLDEKLSTMATLQALGLRNRPMCGIYLIQVGLLGLLSGVIGGVSGMAISRSLVAWGGGSLGLPAAGSEVAGSVFGVVGLSILFSVLTAYVFAFPPLARALSVKPAGLFRGSVHAADTLQGTWKRISILIAFVYGALFVFILPQPWMGVGFLLCIGLLLLLLEALVRGLRRFAIWLEGGRLGRGGFAWHLALANLYRPHSPLRVTLLSLGSALTLLVACTLLVATLTRALSSTIPEESPALILYEIFPDQLPRVEQLTREVDPDAQAEWLPIVRGRLQAVDGIRLPELPDRDPETIREALGDEYKLSYLSRNPDALTLIEGAWWNDGPSDSGLPLIALEDREARELGLAVDDRLTFSIGGSELEARVAAIYTQKGLQTRFWFEGILQQGALDPFINRYAGAIYQEDSDALALQNRLIREAPNVITLRTEEILQTAGELLAKAAGGLTVIAAISLTASLLVMASVVSVSRSRQIQEANVLHCLGARQAAIRQAMILESLVLTGLASLFATGLGAAIALPLAAYRLKLPALDLMWLAAAVALAVSLLALMGGLLPTLRRLRLQPAALLREA